MYLSFVLPTRPMSELYGRAQPFGQPVIRVVKTSFSRPSSLQLGFQSASIIVGSTRSLSVTASPHVGSAGQAIDQRRTVGVILGQRHAMPPQNLFEPAAVVRRDVAEDDALVRREPQRRPKRRANLAERRLEPHRFRVFDPAVLDVQAVEPLAVALLVPAHAVVEAVHADRPQRLERVAEILFDLVLEPRDAPVVDQVLHAGDLAVGPVAEVALHLDDRDAQVDRPRPPSM